MSIPAFTDVDRQRWTAIADQRAEYTSVRHNIPFRSSTWYMRTYFWLSDQILSDADGQQGKVVPEFQPEALDVESGPMGIGLAAIGVVSSAVFFGESVKVLGQGAWRRLCHTPKTSYDWVCHYTAGEHIKEGLVGIAESAPSLFTTFGDLSLRALALLADTGIGILSMETIAVLGAVVIAPISLGLSIWGALRNGYTILLKEPRQIRRCEEFLANGNGFTYEDAEKVASIVGDFRRVFQTESGIKVSEQEQTCKTKLSKIKGMECVPLAHAIRTADRLLWNQDLVGVLERSSRRSRVDHAVSLIRNIGAGIAIASTAALTLGGEAGAPVIALGLGVGGGTYGLAAGLRGVLWSVREAKKWWKISKWNRQLEEKNPNYHRNLATYEKVRRQEQLWLLRLEKGIRNRKKLESRQSGFTGKMLRGLKLIDSKKEFQKRLKKIDRQLSIIQENCRKKSEDRLKVGTDIDQKLKKNHGYTTRAQKKQEMISMLNWERQSLKDLGVTLDRSVTTSFMDSDGIYHWNPSEPPRRDATATEMVAYFFFQEELHHEVSGLRKGDSDRFLSLEEMRDIYLKKPRWK